MDTLIHKVITGNASPEEISKLNTWISESEANKNTYNSQALLWDLIGKAEKKPEVDLENAWVRFNAHKEVAVKKSFVMYKLAAVFILVLGASSLLFLFNESNKIMTAHKSKKELIKQEPVNSNKTLLSENISDVKPTKTYKAFQKRNDTTLLNEIVLVDSSSAKITATSVLKILDHTPNQPRIASLSGAGLFDIKPSDKDFILETEDLKIKVQGTKFNIKTATEEYQFVEISVEEGFMEVYEKANPQNKVNISSKEKYIYDVKNHIFVEQKKAETKSSKWSKFINKIFDKSH